MLRQKNSQINLPSALGCAISILNEHGLSQIKYTPGARQDSPGKIIVKYFPKKITIESRDNFHDYPESYSKAP